MFVGITNTPRDYAWGSQTAIAELLGTGPSGSPEAELWLGAHPGSPSRIVDPGLTGGATDLATWIAADPATTLGAGATETPRLPFLLKVLAAASPLSLQAHPTSAGAVEGFARENLAGIPVDAPHRNYRDEYPKPEIIYALHDGFEALCGFRPVAESAAALTALDAGSGRLEPLVSRLNSDADLRETFHWLISGGADVAEIVSATVDLAAGNERFRGVTALAEAYPGDPGIVISLLMHRVTLAAGEVLSLPAGNIHAYLGGLGVELMTASDNVLRGGLTPKHVDVPELLSVLDFSPVAVPYLPAERVGDVAQFQPEGADFRLVHLRGGGRVELTGPAIVLCTDGEVQLSGREGTAWLLRGQSVFVTPGEEFIDVAEGGTVFVATTAA